MTGESDLATDDRRRRIPRFQGEHLARNLTIVEALRSFAADRDRTPAQIAIAWLLAQGHDVVPIPGSKRVRHVEENVSAADIELSDDDLSELDRIAPIGASSGERYTEAGMKKLNL